LSEFIRDIHIVLYLSSWLVYVIRKYINYYMENIYPKGEDERFGMYKEIRNKGGRHSEQVSVRLKGDLYGSGIERKKRKQYKQK
jgi:hypothetical protein